MPLSSLHLRALGIYIATASTSIHTSTAFTTSPSRCSSTSHHVPSTITNPPPHHPHHYSRSHPLAASIARDAEIVMDDEDDDGFDWMTDRERFERMNYGIPPPPPHHDHYFNPNIHPPPHPDEFLPYDAVDNRPLRNAAAFPNDSFEEDLMDGEESGATTRDATSNPRSRTDSSSSSSSSSSSTQQKQQQEQKQQQDNQQQDNQQQQQQQQQSSTRKGPSIYTQEEQDLITSLSGNQPSPNDFQPAFHEQFGNGAFLPPPNNFREEGYLGDCSLKEISMDYAIPICYLADVIASWGAPLPIDPHARLGDLVTGEQAFAILEAIHTLETGALHERYSEECLMDVCEYYDLDLKEAFEFCMGRGWSLPFGVRTFLRVEQEEELLDALGAEMY